MFLPCDLNEGITTSKDVEFEETLDEKFLPCDLNEGITTKPLSMSDIDPPVNFYLVT